MPIWVAWGPGQPSSVHLHSAQNVFPTYSWLHLAFSSIFTISTRWPAWPFAPWSVQGSTAYQLSAVCRWRPLPPAIVPVFVWIEGKVPSLVEAALGLLAEVGHFLPDLIGDLDLLALVLPIGEFGVMELLFKFGLHVDQFFFLGSPLVDLLFGSTSRGWKHGGYRIIDYDYSFFKKCQGRTYQGASKLK